MSKRKSRKMVPAVKKPRRYICMGGPHDGTQVSVSVFADRAHGIHLSPEDDLETVHVYLPNGKRRKGGLFECVFQSTQHVEGRGKTVFDTQ